MSQNSIIQIFILIFFRGEGFLKAKKEKGQLDEQLREYINEWRTQRGKEEEELKRLKEKQAKRKEIRAEQEKKLAQQKKVNIFFNCQIAMSMRLKCLWDSNSSKCLWSSNVLGAQLSMTQAYLGLKFPGIQISVGLKSIVLKCIGAQIFSH